MLYSDDFFTQLDGLTQNSPYPTQLSKLKEAKKSHVILDFIPDYERYYFGSGPIKLKMITDFPGLLGTLFYRISRYLFLNQQEEVALQLSNASRYLTHMELDYSAEIGSGLKVNNGLGLVIGPRVKIGQQALLHHNITLGAKNGGFPVIGNRVTIYPGAMVLGAINVGDGSTVGANSLVLHTFPKESMLVGTPAQNIRVV